MGTGLRNRSSRKQTDPAAGLGDAKKVGFYIEINKALEFLNYKQICVGG